MGANLVSHDWSLLVKNVRNFKGGLLSSLFPKNHSKCLKTAISLKLSTFSHSWVLIPMAQSLKKKILKSERWNPIWLDPKVLMILLCKNLSFGYFQVLTHLH